MKTLREKSPESYQKLLDLQREKRRRKESCPSRDYIPNGKSEEFIKLVGSNKCFVNLFVGANGTSKTSTGVNIITNIVFGVQSKWFEQELFQNWPYIKKGRIISDPTTLKEKTIPELQKWFPKNEAEHIPAANYETAKEGKNYISTFTTKTGWEIDLMSSEQEVKEFESVDLGFVWIDEPISKDIFMATVARARLGMIIIWTFTPLFYSAWIKNWLDDHANGEYADYIEAEMEDNCQIHGVRGFFKHEDIQRIADALPEDERQARVFGKFGHLLGRVHKGFKRKIHVVKAWPLKEKDYTTYMALDPHPRVGDHSLYLSVDRKGRKIVTGEIISQGLVRELAAKMRAFEPSMNYRMEGRIIDPAAYTDDQHMEEKSVGSQLFDLGLHFIKGSKDLMAGIKRTNDALDYELKEGKFLREPELFIFDTCLVTIKQIEEYVWSEWKGPTKDDKQDRGTPKDINDHQVENLHRLLLSEPVFIPYQLRESGIPEPDNPDPY